MKTLWRAAGTALIALAAPAQAHRLDEFLQSATIRVTPDRVALYLRLVPGENVAQQVWEGIDTDRDGQLSAAEQGAYVRQVLADTTLTIDGRPVDLETLAAWFPARADVEKGIGQISLSLQAPWVLASGAHRLQLVSGHRRALSVYLVNTLVPVERELHITGQQRSVDQTHYVLDFQREKIATLKVH